MLSIVSNGLDATESGLDAVYRGLDQLRTLTGAEEVIAVLEDPTFGRQAFRASRSPADSVWARELILNGAPGVYASSETIDDTVSVALQRLFTVALRLDSATHDAHHDHLTGLLNRRAFDDVLEEACARSRRYGWAFGLVLLDLDSFKSVNDQLGHPAGDAVLRAVGDELRHHLRLGDTGARLGGDEFAVLLPNLANRRASEFVGRIQSAIRRDVPDANVTTSTGVALAPMDGVTPDALYRRADAELYTQKRNR